MVAMSTMLSVSLFLISALNGQVPAGQAQAPPAAVNPANPQPVTPQQPPATSQYRPPVQQPLNPYGGFMPHLTDPKTLDCRFGSCRNRRITMSPGQGFTLKCEMPFQCDGLDLTLNIAHDPTNWGSQVSDINNLEFNAPTNGVTIRMNSLTGQNIEIDNLNCKVTGACRNLKILAGFGIETWGMNVKCEMPGACTGCTINGMSCEMLSMMNGNNNGFMPYGYGYTNQPAVPQQQPGFGAPGAMPQPVQPANVAPLGQMYPHPAFW